MTHTGAVYINPIKEARLEQPFYVWSWDRRACVHVQTTLGRPLTLTPLFSFALLLSSLFLLSCNVLFRIDKHLNLFLQEGRI